MARRPTTVVEKLRHGLIVSCQAEGADPFNSPQLLARFAAAAVLGGAAGIRACGTSSVHAIRKVVSQPIIGLTKGSYPNGRVLITPELSDVGALLRAGADLIAVDATLRRRSSGLAGNQLVAEIVKRWSVPIVADVSTLEEGRAAREAGAAFVATTLAGYTDDTALSDDREPDWALLRALVRAKVGPVILEGRVWKPEQAKRGLDLGAHAVVVGTAITRPRVVTRAFVDAMI